MGIAEAMTFHRNKLEMADNFTESDLSDGTKNPKYRTVAYWHTIWLQYTTADLVPLSGPSLSTVSVCDIVFGEHSPSE